MAAPAAAPATIAPSGPQAADDSSFGGPSASQEAAAESAAGLTSAQKAGVAGGYQTQASPGTPANSPLLTTSAQSRGTTAGNVSAFTAATTPPPQTTVTPTTQGEDTAAEDTTNPNNNTNGSQTAPTPPTSDAGLPTGYSYTLPAAGTPYTTVATAQGPAYSSQGLQTTSPQQIREQSGTYQGADGNYYYNSDSTPAPGPVPVGGNPTAPAAETDSSSSTDSSGVQATVAAGGIPSPADLDALGIPKSLQGLYISNLQNAQTEQTAAYQTLQEATALKNNDPAIAQAVASITASYQTLIDAQNKKNAQLLGRASASVGAFGGLGVMSQSFMSDEMNTASENIADLTGKMQTAILNSQSAIEKEDLTSFNDAMASYKTANSNMTTAIQDLMTAAKDQVTETQAQQKIDNAAANAQVANDLKNAKGVAAQVAATLAAAGADPTSYDFTDLAQQYGISDPDILASAVQTAAAANTKAGLANSNTQSEITDRDSNAADTTAKTNATLTKDAAAPKLTAAQAKSGTISYINSILSKKAADGTPYTAEGGFITPAGWKNILSIGAANGVSSATLFEEYSNKLFPASSADYELTPEQQAEVGAGQ